MTVRLILFSEIIMKADVLVVDSGGFLKAAPLREVGEQLVTLHEVVAELRDKEVRQRLQLLPELQFQQPGGEAVRDRTSKLMDECEITGWGFVLIPCAGGTTSCS